MAGVKFEAVLKNDGIGGWCIELTDTLEPKTVRCANLEIFSQEVSSLGEDYGNDIEVVWSTDEDVKPEFMQELRIAMMEYQEKYKDEIDKELNKDESLEANNEGFNPNAN